MTLIVAAVLAVALAVAMPLKVEAQSDSTDSSASASSAQTPADISASQQQSIVAMLEPALSLRLRQPLGQAAPSLAATQQSPTESSAPAATSDQLPFTLVGTIGDSLALLRGADGNVEIKGVDENIAGAQVVAISPGEIRVRYNGKIAKLVKPKEVLPGE